nr:MAG TPA: hypothetical protein [Caudoviricetes sp.]
MGCARVARTPLIWATAWSASTAQRVVMADGGR